MVFGREPLTWVVKEACKRIEINCHNWKSRSLSKMKEHVKNHIKLDTTGMLAGLTDDGSLITFFASTYSASNFVWVFEFVWEKINIEQSASKSPHAAYYSKTKLHLDWESDHFRRVEDLNSQEAILRMFNLMVISDNYADLEPEDFVREIAKPRQAKGGAKRAAPPDEDVQYCFVGDKPPPKRYALNDAIAGAV
ncbi:MAG: hypothetical protein FRX48_03495 [Lasallia pustulata]|uniref:Uncharacterized protein n=1 Tax=Lasallia pustulata TaxID=136370 RepID=A0A5M8PSU5_9LECA|nr:MAG: hypothetical protein FRX48_03495 [Lasallia pustulata]